MATALGACRCPDAQARKDWDFWYKYTERHCIHGANCERLRALEPLRPRHAHQAHLHRQRCGLLPVLSVLDLPSCRADAPPTCSDGPLQQCGCILECVQRLQRHGGGMVTGMLSRAPQRRQAARVLSRCWRLARRRECCRSGSSCSRCCGAAPRQREERGGKERLQIVRSVLADTGVCAGDGHHGIGQPACRAWTGLSLQACCCCT